MNENKILHVMILDKFLAPFIDFVDENFGRDNHHYVFITSEKYDYGLTPEHKVEFLHTDDDIFITLLKYMKMAKKIILHGLWRDKVDILLYFNQKLLKKCYWAMWGGDFYFPEKQSWIKKQVIKNMGYLLSQIKGEVALVRKWYGAKGEHIKLTCGYPSNVYHARATESKKTKNINIMVGNSATLTNLHLNIFDKLAHFKEKDIKIYAPLSYGDKNYAQEVITSGKELFGDRFVAINEFMEFEKYLKFLSEIDIAILYQSRQQSVGNLINLLGQGKTVYLNKNTTVFKFIEELGIRIYDLEEFNLELLDPFTIESNKNIIRKSFSMETLLEDCKKYLN